MRKFIRKSAAVLAIAAFSLLGIAGYYESALPDNIMTTGEPEIETFFTVTAAGAKQAQAVSSGDSASNVYTLSLFGSVPIKDVTATKVDAPMLCPCGEPFGIRLITDGVLVVDMQSQGGFDGTLTCPAARCGIRIGDIIMSIGGQSVASNNDISAVVESSGGEPLNVRLKRNGEIMELTLTPEMSGGKYRAGMWVRDSSAGIGTLTFYDEQTGAFGGLGHPICDADTRQPLPLSDGNTGEVEITGVEKSRDGDPGELIGTFRSSGATGVITANTGCGVFGRTFTKPTAHKAIPLGFKQEIHEGRATIYTTTDGDEPYEYEIEIKSIDLSENAEHSMIIEVTDKELLEKAGGIVQGMSGSPIMQDGKLIGAVTHVFTDDPKQGYAVFAEMMLEAAGE
ncbi:MAG: SpoIVB peptidase [Ruminococcus sp.]|nr:SpoIVB peptidase [Ruminococcus sp.]